MLQVRVRLTPIRLPLSVGVLAAPRNNRIAAEASRIYERPRCVTPVRSHFVINGFIEPLIYLDVPNEIVRTLLSPDSYTGESVYLSNRYLCFPRSACEFSSNGVKARNFELV